VYQAKRAYFGFLTARDSRLFLEDMQVRLNRLSAASSGISRKKR